MRRVFKILKVVGLLVGVLVVALAALLFASRTGAKAATVYLSSFR